MFFIDVNRGALHGAQSLSNRPWTTVQARRCGDSRRRPRCVKCGRSPRKVVSRHQSLPEPCLLAVRNAGTPTARFSRRSRFCARRPSRVTENGDQARDRRPKANDQPPLLQELREPPCSVAREQGPSFYGGSSTFLHTNFRANRVGPRPISRLRVVRSSNRDSTRPKMARPRKPPQRASSAALRLGALSPGLMMRSPQHIATSVGQTPRPGLRRRAFRAKRRFSSEKKSPRDRGLFFHCTHLPQLT